MSSAIALGIDLRRTFSTACIKSNGKITSVRLSRDGYRMENLVYWPRDANPIVGRKAIRAAYHHPKFMYALFDGRMNYDEKNQADGGRSVVELASVLIQEIIRAVCKSQPEIGRYVTGQRPRDGLVIGVVTPASWEGHQTEAIGEAVKSAGTEIDTFIPDRSAADFLLPEEKRDALTDIHGMDWEGGTVDCTVVKATIDDQPTATLREWLSQR